jgi:uncharacterized protein YjiS (DUF1127 family)
MHRIASLIKLPIAILTDLRKASQRRANIATLERLSDRTLNDIGVDRRMIAETVDAMMARNSAKPAPLQTVPTAKPVQPAPAPTLADITANAIAVATRRAA